MTMRNAIFPATLVASLAVLTASAFVYADEGGVVQKTSKEATKGAIKGAEQQMDSDAIVKGAKKVTKGMVQGLAEAAPLVSSQIANQANVNRKAIGNVARQVSSDAVTGAFGATVREVDEALGPDGNGPLGTTLAATSEKVTRATVRGIVSEIRLDPATAERLSAAAMRGAVSELHFNIRVWPLVLAFVLGGVATFLCGLGLTLLYLLFKRNQKTLPPAPVPGTATTIRTQPLQTTT